MITAIKIKQNKRKCNDTECTIIGQNRILNNILEQKTLTYNQLENNRQLQQIIQYGYNRPKIEYKKQNVM